MKAKLFLVFLVILGISIQVSGQKKEKSKKIIVTGTVKGPDNKPAEGAAIFVDSVYTKNVTDEQGNYRVRTDADAKFIIAAIPDKFYGKTEIKDPAATDIIVKESLVTAPGFVNAALKANAKQLAKVHKINTYPNIYEMIRAEVPGVTVSGTSVTVKQGHSFFGSSTPIYVVNGVRVNSVDNITPTQVKKIELLTGSQASMYSGVDGTPGVIRITLFTGSEK